MKRALAERVKQEQEAASSSSGNDRLGGHPLRPPSAGGLHPKAPPSQLPAFDAANGALGMAGGPRALDVPLPGGGAGGDLGLGPLSGPPGMSRPQSMLPPDLLDHGGGDFGHRSAAASLDNIPRRSLPPPPISSPLPPQSQKPPSLPSSPSQLQPQPQPQPQQPHPQQPQPQPQHSQPQLPRQHPPPSPGPSAKKRPRTGDSSPRDRLAPTNGDLANPPAADAKPRRRESKRPSANSSGNAAAYARSRTNAPASDDDDDDDDRGKRTRKGYRRSVSNASRSTGRTRCSVSDDDGDGDDDDDDDEQDPARGKLFLQHQNRALASELYAYRRRIYLLERERAYRRRECRLAEKKMREVEGVASLGFFGNGGAVKNENGTHPSIPFSTGLGSDVELTRTLLLTIQDLASSDDPLPNNSHHHHSKRSKTKEPPPDDDPYSKHVDDMNHFENYSRHGDANVPDDEDLMEEKSQLDEMEDLACHVANRAMKLRDGILEMIRVASGAASSSSCSSSSLSSPPSSSLNVSKGSYSVPLLKEKIVQLEGQLRANEERLEEMAKSRNEAVASERRVRRGLYRLACGRMKMEDVFKAVEKEDNGVSFMETIAMIDGMNNQKHTLSSPDGAAVVSSSAVLSSSTFSATARGNVGDSVANSEDAAQLKKNLQDVQVIADAREKKISELLGERKELLKRINSLLLPGSKLINDTGADEDTVRKSSLFIDTTTKLETAERRIQELEGDCEKIRQKWAVTKGDLELAKKTMSEMEGKHERRWNELLSTFSESESAPISSDGEPAKGSLSSAKKIAELESKLRQAMEAVGRMETLRATLADAYKMNETLQSKIDDLKTKNAKMLAEKSAARAKEIESVTSPQASFSKKASSESSSGNDHKLEKLKQEYRRVRKEVAAAVLSKDQAKLKQERAEKERDNLMKTNVRLLKQGSEKDDMNAKSLSTILHLKQRNEELEKENAIIKQKAQAAQQLSLAARLASNAKDRVGEEALREKELLDETVQKLNKECELLREDKQKADVLLTQCKEEMKSISKDLEVARERCDELVTESNKKEEEKKHMMESLAVAKKEALESAKKAALNPSSSSHGSVKSEFTMEQMTTQVKYLSDRINCPVCNTREKKCILLRCRHMFCRQCVDENIKNRSRKCPACAQRFDTKDVGEIWL